MVSMLSNESFTSDEEEDLCPLCIEEMDLSDKNFKPCPCGYQICQFCYNYIRNNPEMTGRCPACRRPYDDESVEYKQVSAEEVRKEQARQARKEKDRKQRERERKETEQQAKKNLAGVRVIQKNLVYVIGLNPNIPTDELDQTLRGDQFFGQYGKIKKIVINKRTNAQGNLGIGVYVTFERKEDAAKCIAAVDSSVNDGRVLRAAYGTTKYCSAYLRGQNCPNPNCMFLHEPGEEADSFSRRDLSTTMQHNRDRSATPSAPPLPSVTAAHAQAQAASRSSSGQQHPPPVTALGAQPSHPQPLGVATAPPLSSVPPPVSSPVPAWGKPATLVPTTKRLVEEDDATRALKMYATGVSTLLKHSNVVFKVKSGNKQDSFSPIFNIPLTENDRLQIWQTAMAKLDALEAAERQSTSPLQTPAALSKQSDLQSSPGSSSRGQTPSSMSPSPAPAPPPGLSKAQNSGELLAHLMKDKPRTSTAPSQSVY